VTQAPRTKLRILQPGELQALPVASVKFDVITHRKVPSTTVLLGIGIAYYAGFDNVRCSLQLTLSGNIVCYRELPPGMELAHCD
jgi:hypothetical protein